ncbi:helix-turn-helix domain-containing protein [Teredinibacter purpureus]|uniref:helix-turn-helix domain-containing protein n=1 Tax=Teredinibacter purpureus TaxID=2731756 RepID=UPI0005F87CDA|nr:helix-turn-helix transcriptional regulator [Teredinibacter purpureus]
MFRYERLVKARQAVGLTQRQLGERLGCSGSAVAQWETGETANIRLEYLFLLADISGYSARWLATGRGAARLFKWVPEEGFAALVARLDSDERWQLMQALEQIDD